MTLTIPVSSDESLPLEGIALASCRFRPAVSSIVRVRAWGALEENVCGCPLGGHLRLKLIFIIILIIQSVVI